MATHQRHEHRDGNGQLLAHEPDWPDWTNWNDPDPGLTLVTLFAFLAAGLLWRSSGPHGGRGSALYRLLGIGLAAVGASAWLLRRRQRRRRPWERERSS